MAIINRINCFIWKTYLIKVVLCVCWLGNVQNLCAQIVSTQSIINVGKVDANNSSVRINLFNQSSETIHSIVPRSNHIIKSFTQQNSIQPGEAITFSLHFSSKGLRNLNETVLLQVNNEEVPISIQLIGHYKSVNRKQNQDCPDFSRSNKKYRPNPKKRKSKLSTTASNIILIDKQNLVTNESTIDKPTNLILLIDASTSMNDEVKKELLRVALLELTATFKPTDQLTVMSYSSDANVLLPQQKAVSANQLDSILQHLEVGGFTNGSLGILEAYKMADSIYDIHANNEIILATDGAFNTNETNDIIEDIIDTYASTDIKLSILGIRNQSWAADDMKKLTEAGNGKYIHVNSLQNAKKSLKKR